MHRKHGLGGLIGVALAILIWTQSLVAVTIPPPHPDLAAVREQAPGTTRVSLTPSVEVVGASALQRQGLHQAVDRFVDLGLALPDLRVRFSEVGADCDGHMGLFETESEPWQITICSDAGFVYEHELAHAWESANLTDQDRETFVRLRGHQTWADPDVPWSEQGVEDAAFIIQQGLLDVPLVSERSEEMQGRLTAFELLTGVPSPRLEK
jgi:hypothetical protein